MNAQSMIWQGDTSVAGGDAPVAGDPTKQRVAGEVPVGLVELPEGVGVEHDDRERPRPLAGRVDLHRGMLGRLPFEPGQASIQNIVTSR